MSQTPQTGRFPRRLVTGAMAGLGLSSIMTQLALTRELLDAFSGNELVLGIGLGSWLLLTGLGTWLGRFTQGWPTVFLVKGLGGVALLPLAQVVAVRALRDVVFTRGATAGVLETTAGCLGLLFPFCVLSGVLLSFACGLLSRSDENASELGQVYAADTAGSIVGGALFSFALVPWLDHFALLCVPAFVNLALTGLLARQLRARGQLLAAAGGVTALAALLSLVNVDQLTTAIKYPGRNVIYRSNSPYGRLVVTDHSGQLDFYENGTPVLSTQMVEQVEETVHYAMSQRPDARKVLLISGGIAGTAREILRYPKVEEVTYVELDPRIVEAGLRFLPGQLADPRIRTVTTDGRRFVQQTAEHFDVVIVAVPDPTTTQLNRFFTAEFFLEARRILVPGGVIGFGLGHYENYVNPPLAALLASAQHTVSATFANVRLVPSGRVFYLASDGPLSLDIATRLEQRGLTTQLVKRSYLDAMLAPDRLADLDRAIVQPAAINTDFEPVLYYYHLRHWLGQFAFQGQYLAGGLGLALAIYLWRLHSVQRIVFATGFAASALEVVLLLVYQGLYGSLYQQVGLVVTVFMAGLTLGAWQANRRGRQAASNRRLAGLAIAIAGLAAILPFALRQLNQLDLALSSPLAGQGAILALTFVLALMVGALFPLAGELGPANGAHVAAQLYTADLVGASLGALLVSTLLIPLLGVTTVCLLTTGLNLAAVVPLLRRANSP